MTGAFLQLIRSLLPAEDRLIGFAAVSALASVGGQVFGLCLLATGSAIAATYAWGAVLSRTAA
ncbi:MAG TPA: hypothetical protein VF635_06610, partial [Propionibacteriaceae bacterium]